MTEILEYQDRASLIVDLKLYVALRNNSQIDLSMLPKITRERWPWMVARWDNGLYRQFFEFSNGDEYLRDVLERLDDHVLAWRDGSRVNPFESAFIFSDSNEFLELITVDAINPSIPETRFIDLELQRVGGFDEANFREMLKFLKESRENSFDSLGLDDPVYDTYRGRDSYPKQREVLVPDLYVLDEALELEQFIEGIIYQIRTQNNLEPNLIEYANENLASGNSEIRALDIYRSFITVPFEQSLEQMARDYLGDENQWFELVTVNKLKDPYVDLYGQKEFVLENGSAQSVKVRSGNRSRFRVGMSVKTGSRLVPDEIRTVQSVIENPDNTSLVTLSGASDLTKLKINEQAYLRVYAPDTIRDFSFVKIPINVTAPFRNVPEPTLGVLKELDRALYVFGVDLKRDDLSGDLRLSPENDLGITFGLEAVRQAVINVIKTEKGELAFHREFGIPNQIGIEQRGPDAASTIANSLTDAIRRDERFTSVDITDIIISEEGEISVSLNVTIAGSSQLIPLAFVV